jgi:flavin reductase
MVMATEFRDAMSRLGAAVNVVTTDGSAGLGGFTASAVCSVTDSPPTLLVCMNRCSQQYSRFSENGVLCVNVLGADQEHVSRVFSGQTRTSIEARFEQTGYERLITGAPAVEESLVSFDCEIDRIEEVGTHGVFICRVVQIWAGTQTGGLLYFNRQYHRLASQEARHECATTARIG